VCVWTLQTAVGTPSWRAETQGRLSSSATVRLLHGNISAVPAGANGIFHRQETGNQLLKFLGVVILGTRYEFDHRADLWRTEAGSPIIQAPAFGTKTGMPRKRFEDIWSSLTFSRQVERRDDEGSAAHRWRLLSDFVESINSHRAAYFSPSELVCVDECMSRW
jgi:hypothetical protein